MARVLISMPERFLDEIDKVAGNENRTRSELIREALRTYMYRNQIRYGITNHSQNGIMSSRGQCIICNPA